MGNKSYQLRQGSQYTSQLLPGRDPTVWHTAKYEQRMRQMPR